MNALSVIILAAVAALAAAAVRYIIKHHACSGCGGGQCSGNCSGCQGCSAYGKSEEKNRKKGQP